MDPNVYPATNVLRNLRGIRDADPLTKFEMDMTTRRVTELEHSRTRGRFDAAQMQGIHKYIFQDVFDWAGKFRTVNISRSGDSFAIQEYIAPCLDTVRGKLLKEQHLAGADLGQFAKRAAYYFGEINAIHPFRDGNGRTQREFFRQLALRNKFGLEWSAVTRDQMYEASVKSFKLDDFSGLETILRGALRATG